MQQLIFGEITRNPDARALYDISEVIADKEWLRTADNFALYYM